MKRLNLAWFVSVILVPTSSVLGMAGLLNVDHRSLVSRTDPDYNEPASRSEKGLPIGNGRTGELGLDFAVDT